MPRNLVSLIRDIVKGPVATGSAAQAGASGAAAGAQAAGEKPVEVASAGSSRKGSGA